MPSEHRTGRGKGGGGGGRAGMTPEHRRGRGGRIHNGRSTSTSLTSLGDFSLIPAYSIVDFN